MAVPPALQLFLIQQKSAILIPHQPLDADYVSKVDPYVLADEKTVLKQVISSRITYYLKYLNQKKYEQEFWYMDRTFLNEDLIDIFLYNYFIVVEWKWMVVWYSMV